VATSHFPVEAGHIMMFARAIGDTNPVYDPARAADTPVGGVIAPPTFVVAAAQYDPTYPLRPRPGEPWMGSGSTPSGTAGTAGSGGGDRSRRLHAEQHFEYHRPLKAGDVLIPDRREGERWQKQGKRGGTLQFIESIVEYRNKAGELVITARSVSVVTSRTPEEANV